jgi:vancomycin resistance protein YoaR
VTSPHDPQGSGLDAATTRVEPTGPGGPAHRTDATTTFIPRTDGPDGPDGPGGPDGPDGTGGGAPGRSGWSPRRKVVLGGAVVVGLLAVLYVGDLLVSSTDVPRGVAVAGVEIGGMSKPEAEAALRSELGPRVSRPIALTAGDTTAQLDPRAAGLDVDWDATIAQAGEQPLAPWTRIRSLFSTREVAPVSTGNPYAVGQALGALRPQLDRAPVEGTIAFRGAEPVAVPSRPGQAVDPQAGTDAVLAHWLDPVPVALPVTVAPVTVTPEGIETALRDVARPAVAGPLYVVGDRRNATVSTQAIGSFLKFDPDGSGGLTPRIDAPAAEKAISPQLASTEAEPKDATLAFQGAATSVVPAVVGREIDWNRTLEGGVEALARPTGPAPPTWTPPPSPPGATPAAPPPAQGRAVNAVYTTTPPKVTTEALQALGPATIIGEFQTGGFAADSGQNIRRVAEQVNGATVAPGEVFSLNGFTGPRDAGKGYVEAGIIEDGVPARGIGGGISQFATTLYNASYFAGMEDVEHKEHSYWISRYPAGREATVFEGAIDLKFRNTLDTPVLIRTTWTPSSLKVQLYGQKRFEVTSAQGPRTNPVAPGTKDLGKNPKCKPSKGVGGFTITDTRTVRDLQTGQTRSQPRTVRYEPEPEITCNDK